MKKRIVITSIVTVVLILACLSPFIYRRIVSIRADKALTKEYEEFVATNNAFYKNSFLNDMDISGKTVEEVLSDVYALYDGMEIVVSGPYEADCVVKVSSIVKKEDLLESYLDESISKQSLTRDEYAGEAKRKDYSFALSSLADYESSDFTGINLFDDENTIESEDACITIDTKKKKASIRDEVYGNRVIMKNFFDKLSNAIDTNAGKVVLLSEDFIRPTVLATDEKLINKRDYFNNLLAKTISFSVCGVNMSLEPESTYKFYDFENEEYINEGAVSEYVNELSKKYNTYGVNRPFVTSTGENVMLDPGDFGWKINTEETKKALKEALLSENSTEKLKVVYDIKGQRPADNEFSNTYVEISLANQKIWMYQDGVLLVYDDVTTGDITDPACASHTGVFKLKNKKPDATLKGPTWEDFVYYWMSFDGLNGMHDATWRTDEEFGGDNRNGNGSHGCTNLRLSTAAIVYNNIKEDTPIIVW